MQQMLLIEVVLFQTMPGWGSTATVDDQIRQHIMHTAHKVYQLGVIKKIGLQFVNLFFFFVSRMSSESDK